jgi:hypothetical protein
MGILFELILQAFFVYHPWGNQIFGTYPIAASIWLALAPFAIFLIIADEVRKKLQRR